MLFQKLKFEKMKWSELSLLFVGGLILHIVTVTIVFLAGNGGWFPDLFDSQGIGDFASDGRYYLSEIDGFIELLRNGESGYWTAKTEGFHTKLYTFSFVLLRPLFGHNILSAELINLICYLSILFFVYFLGKEIFNSLVGLLAALVVGFWPSFLLHTTQLLRDPLFIAGFMGIMLMNTHCLTRNYNSRDAISHIVIGSLSVIPVWLVGSGRWYLTIVIIALGSLGIVIQMVVERRLILWNLVASSLVLIVVLGITIIPTNFTPSPPFSPSPPVNASTPSSLPSQPQNNVTSVVVRLWDEIIRKVNSVAYEIGRKRVGFFYHYPDGSGSNIDIEFQLVTTVDLVHYIPRATTIGLFAPFPNMWFEDGSIGFSARLLSGLETLTMYSLMVFAVIGIWRERRRLAIWHLLVVVLVGAVVLGLTVSNVGALYRIRYSYWILLVVLGVGGFWEVVLPWLRSKIRAGSAHD